MKQLSVAILDDDAVRAEAIREAIAQEDHDVKVLISEPVEEQYDIILLSTAFSPDIEKVIKGLKTNNPGVNIICILSNIDVGIQLAINELGIRHYIDTPITSIKKILDEIEAVEADIMDEAERSSFFVSMFDEINKLPVVDKKLKNKIGIALKMFTSSEDGSKRIKGNIKDVPFFDVVRVVADIYKEGTLEIVNDESRAEFIIKNKAVVSAFVTPGVRGLKAFLRVAGWNKGTFAFKNETPSNYSIEQDIAYTDILELCAVAKSTFGWFLRMRNNIPPKELNIRIDTRSLEKKQEITPTEFDILTTITDQNSINDILNYNSNTDVNILEALIGLRKKGVIEVLS